ncbi:hypothetical protein B5S31_g3779 [[Candida] boidinii]|nr:hypothetical protein B5S29_g4049 [[Candida] boidinii]OWB74008.1 hypothetical protein B5S31_g3779 [[Candida] boidinii]OWB81285.1 hypothetical protein B5S32_g5684 [[Candida] boidinii]GMF16225.1 unnamed protein product [[Candida] boidinii]
MGAAYNILGKSVPPHHLAIGTIGAVVALVIPKPWGTTVKPQPEIQASSKEEEAFITEFLSKHQEKH